MMFLPLLYITEDMVKCTAYLSPKSSMAFLIQVLINNVVPNELRKFLYLHNDTCVKSRQSVTTSFIMAHFNFHYNLYIHSVYIIYCCLSSFSPITAFVYKYKVKRHYMCTCEVDICRKYNKLLKK